MNHVGFAGAAHLAFVPLAGEAEGLVKAGQVVFGTILADFGFEFLIKPIYGVGWRLNYGRFRGAERFRGHFKSIVEQLLAVSH
jgi:hypothetical protein